MKRKEEKEGEEPAGWEEKTRNDREEEREDKTRAEEVRTERRR